MTYKKEMTKKQFKRVESLVKNECANYHNGYCCGIDFPCPQISSNINLCSYFKDCVLPLDKQLNLELLDDGYRKKCTRCTSIFISASKNKFLCDSCSKESKKASNRRSDRQYKKNSRKREKSNLKT